MSRFFIDRPILAWVLSLLIMLAGLLSISALPVAQYPDIAPPTVGLYATYPGASAQVVEETVTSVIEREMNGVPGLMYMSASSSVGQTAITLSFKQGVDADLAAVDVQNRLKSVESRLPEAVRRNGLSVEKSADSMHLFVTLTSDDGRLSEIELGEIASATVIQNLRRIEGVGRVQNFGAEHAMRIWPDAEKMAALELTSADITAAVRSQSERITIGELGNIAVPDDAPISASIISGGMLSTPEEFGDIVLRTRADGSAIHLRDVARVEMGGSDYSFKSSVNGKVASGMAVKMAPGANIVRTIGLIRAEMDALERYLPPGVSYQIPYETASFIEISINKVMITLIEAMLLVFIVLFLFMQNWRATLIPALVVPIALLGTFAVMLALGYSINVLTMFGMVLAIGILVDDAIVVVENVERLITEEGLSPYDATVKAMSQIGSAIVGITVVLTSVFVPMFFFSGAVGNIYRQFAVALGVSIAFSAFLALSLTPALCATFLRPLTPPRENSFFGRFNRAVVRATGAYAGGVARLLAQPLRWLLIYAGIIALIAVLFVRLPDSFLPDEDQGFFNAMIAMPQGATLAESMALLKASEKYLLDNEPIEYVYSLAGFGFYGSGPGEGSVFVALKDWSLRHGKGQDVQSIVNRLNAHFQGHAGGMVFAFNSPTLPDLGVSSGFDLRLQDRGGVGRTVLASARDQLLASAATNPFVENVMLGGQFDAPQVVVDIDRKKAQAMGVSMDDIGATLATMFGSDYIGDFVHNGQVRRIVVQAEGRGRVGIDDIRRLYVRNAAGAMVPLSAFVTLNWTVGPPTLMRYNGYPSVTLTGNAVAGESSGKAMQVMEQLAGQLPQGIGFSWTGRSLEELSSGAQAPLLFGLSILVVFLALAALYENWFVPLAVMLVVPLGILGALLGVTLRGMPNDIYFKVGLITIIGLSAKNAILIVEVAKDLYQEGKSLTEAALEASRLRLRPIVMTSLAFGAGVLPLTFATGAGSGAQTAIGTGVLGGIITATALAIFWVPLFFVLIGRFFKIDKQPRLATRATQPAQG